MIWGMKNVESIWEGELWVWSVCFAMVQDLHGQETTVQTIRKCCCYCLLSLSPTASILLLPFSAIVQSPEGTNLIPVWSKLMIKLSGIHSGYLAQKPHFHLPKLLHFEGGLGGSFPPHRAHPFKKWCCTWFCDKNMSPAICEQSPAIGHENSWSCSHHHICTNASATRTVLSHIFVQSHPALLRATLFYLASFLAKMSPLHTLFPASVVSSAVLSISSWNISLCSLLPHEKP